MAGRKNRRPGKGLVGGLYKPLTDEQVLKIHQASLEILSRTGVEVDEPDALAAFERSGLNVDGNRVRFSPAVVEDAVRSAPSRILLAGRDPENDLLLEGCRVHVGTGGAALQVLDLDSGDIRPAKLKDVVDTAKVVDALPNIHFFVIPVYPTDVPVGVVDLNMIYAALSNTGKHVQSGMYKIQGIRDVVAMCEHIIGGAALLRERPIVSFITSWMTSPLKFTSGVTKLLMEVCRQGMPVVLSAAPTAGTTAPVTLAGMLALLNAEQLAGLVLTQIVQPACPILLGPVPATSDLRSGKYLAGAVEFGLCNAAIAQLAHYYQIPIYNSAGLTDAKIPDIQAGMEKAQSLIQVALAGSNFIHHAAGLLEEMSTIAYEQFVIDNELLGMAMRAVQGITVDEDTLAVEVIDQVGPGGHFLLEEHTLRYMLSEHYYLEPIFDRKWRPLWEEAGATSAWDRAKEAAYQILMEYRPEPLDPASDQWIRERFAGQLLL
ncbi:MAG: trimethylamine methyltransferase family protein [Anaerolineales bacterium]|jgi:trimethylamine--corrinoid protein Co-methyltransferase